MTIPYDIFIELDIDGDGVVLNERMFEFYVHKSHIAQLITELTVFQKEFEDDAT